MIALWKIQFEKGYSLVVCIADRILFRSKCPGLKPLVEALEIDMKSSVVGDKLVGKAAALLLAYGKPKYLYAGRLSKEGISVLRFYGIEFNYHHLIPKVEGCKWKRLVAQKTPKQMYTRCRGP